MESQTPVQVQEFLPGSSVIYAMHGKCYVTGTESRSHSGKIIRFYKLEVRRPTLSRSLRQEPAIWVPVHTAKEQGLRAPMNTAEAENAMQILLSREYFFKWNESWSTLHTKLESTIRLEGGLGLAKVASCLYVLKRKMVAPPSEIIKLQESVHKLLFKELADATGETMRSLEEKASRGLRSKLTPDS